MPFRGFFRSGRRDIFSIYVVVINLRKPTPRLVRSKMLCSTNVEECFDAANLHQRIIYQWKTYLPCVVTCKPGCSETRASIDIHRQAFVSNYCAPYHRLHIVLFWPQWSWLVVIRVINQLSLRLLWALFHASFHWANDFESGFLRSVT